MTSCKPQVFDRKLAIVSSGDRFQGFITRCKLAIVRSISLSCALRRAVIWTSQNRSKRTSEKLSLPVDDVMLLIQIVHFHGAD
jgi:hypothetical protein